MNITKTYHARFGATELRELRAHFLKCVPKRKDVISYDAYAVTLTSTERHQYDTLEQFLASYTDDTFGGYCRARRGDFSFDITCYPKETVVSVEAPKQEHVHDVLNRAAELARAIAARVQEAPSTEPKSPEMLQSFSVDRAIPACLVTKELLGRVETHLIEEVAKLPGQPAESIHADYTLTIADGAGKLVLKRIAQLETALFTDDTTSIRVALLRYHGETRFHIGIIFDRRREYSTINVEIRSVRAREDALSVVSVVLRQLEGARTLNALIITNSSAIGGMFSFLSFSATVLGGLAFASDLAAKKTPAVGTVFMAGAMFLFLFVMLGKAKPYTTFDSVRQRRWDGVVNWLFWSALTFLIFGTAFVFLRRRWLGF